MPTSHFILLVELDPHRVSTLVGRLIRMGIEPIRVADLDEAKAIVRSRSYIFSGVLVPATLPAESIVESLASMRRVDSILPAMVYGKAPDSGQRRLLRQAGIQLALWDGYDDGILRFQINRLLSVDALSTERATRRAPTHVPVRVLVGGREKQGMLYSLSEGGCFIESPRASMDGAQIRILFTLDDEDFELPGTVAFANVPGNLKRPNLPLGMGVRFELPDAETRARIGRLVHARLASLEV